LAATPSFPCGREAIREGCTGALTEHAVQITEDLEGVRGPRLRHDAGDAAALTRDHHFFAVDSASPYGLAKSDLTSTTAATPSARYSLADPPGTGTLGKNVHSTTMSN
jgi:hypothetical protein